MYMKQEKGPRSVCFKLSRKLHRSSILPIWWAIFIPVSHAASCPADVTSNYPACKEKEAFLQFGIHCFSYKYKSGAYLWKSRSLEKKIPLKKYIYLK